MATGVTVSAAGDYVYVDATAAVQSRITTPASNNGFIITPASSLNVTFDSKESTSTSHPAQLLITLTSGATGATGSASIFGDGSDGTPIGVCNISASANWISSLPTAAVQCSNFTVATGMTLTVPSGTMIRATGTITIAGTLTVGNNTVAASSGQGWVAAQPYGASGGIALSPLELESELRAGSRAGGGTVVIAGAGSISVTGTINANGGNGSVDGAPISPTAAVEAASFICSLHRAQLRLAR